MNFKNISLIIPLLCVGLKVIAGPVEKEIVDPFVENESDDEVFSLGEEVDVNGDIAEITEIFSDDEFMATEVIEEVEECSSEDCIQMSKIILSSIDISANPCDNFYQFTCGGWENDENSHDIITDINNKTLDELRSIFESEYIPNEQLSKEDQAYDEKIYEKLKATYDVCMNGVRNETYPNEYFINYIKSVNITENQQNLKDAEELANLFYKIRTRIIDPFINIRPMLEESISHKPTISISYSFDDLLNAWFYTALENNPEKMTTYKNYMKTVLTTIHGNETSLIDTMIESIFNTERKLSAIFKENKLFGALLELNLGNSSNKNVKIQTFKELNEEYPFIHWDSFIKRVYEYYNVGEFVNDDTMIYNPFPVYIEELNKLMEEMTEEDIVYFLEWGLELAVLRLLDPDNHISEELVKTTLEMDEMLNELLDSLSMEEIFELTGYDFSDLFDILAEDDMVDDDIDNLSSNALKNLFITKLKNTFNTLHKRNESNLEMDKDNEEGNEEDKHQICFSKVSSIMSMAISKFFVEKNFSKDEKEEAKEMIENIKEMMIERIPKMEWLDDETRPHAIEKVLKMKDRIGYPDEAMDSKKIYQRYENIEINNMFDLNIEGLSITYGNALKMNLDNNEWQMDAYTVNAYYDFTDNSINFPAAIFQSPYFISNGQDYVNYATVGSIIGHELTHAFDNTGRLYDSEGNFNNWWTDNDTEEFNEYSQCFIDEYNAITYKVNNKTTNVDGQNTLGENLADNGGLTRAYDAWKYSLLKNPEKAAERNLKLPGLENYTIDQLFYIAYGLNYCSKPSVYSKMDVHSPGIARVNGVVANSKHFAQTFNCPTNSPMNPENKCLIW